MRMTREQKAEAAEIARAGEFKADVLRLQALTVLDDVRQAYGTDSTPALEAVADVLSNLQHRRAQLAVDMVSLAENLTRDAARLKNDGDVGNSLGCVQGTGSDLDRRVGEFSVLQAAGLALAKLAGVFVPDFVTKHRRAEFFARRAYSVARSSTLGAVCSVDDCYRDAQYAVGSRYVCDSHVRAVPDDDGAGAVPIAAVSGWRVQVHPDAKPSYRRQGDDMILKVVYVEEWRAWRALHAMLGNF